MYSKEIRELSGVSRDTLRHYVALGILTPQRNTHNGYLEYSDQDVSMLRFALRAKDLGFTLQEIKLLSAKITTASCPHQSVLPDVKRNLSLIQQKIADLQEMEQHLEGLVNDFQDKDCTKQPSTFSF